MPENENPKYVVISLLIDNEATKEQIIAPSDSDNPFLYDLNTMTNGDNPKEAYKLIFDKLKEHVKKYGTLDELVIKGHGHTESLSSGGDNEKNTISTKQFLYSLAAVEKEMGVKLCNRIVFSACETFSELKPEQVDFYRNFAQENNLEIVGTTSLETIIGNTNHTRFVQFAPNGKVIRDKLDCRYSLFALMGDDRTWIDYHLNKTKDEVEQTLKQELIDEAAELIKYKGIEPASVTDMRLKEITAKDYHAEGTDVIFSEKENAYLIVSADGVVRARGLSTKLHPMSEAEKTAEIKGFEEGLKEFTGTLSRDDKIHIEAMLKYFSGSPTAKTFAAVARDDNKSILLATKDGAYEVITISTPSETPLANKTNHSLEK
jgi:hypothetical protein